MIRLSELKLPLAQVPTEHRRAADAPTETDLDREPPPHPVEALTRLAAAALAGQPQRQGQGGVDKGGRGGVPGGAAAIEETAYELGAGLHDPAIPLPLFGADWDTRCR